MQAQVEGSALTVPRQLRQRIGTAAPRPPASQRSLSLLLGAATRGETTATSYVDRSVFQFKLCIQI